MRNLSGLETLCVRSLFTFFFWKDRTTYYVYNIKKVYQV